MIALAAIAITGCLAVNPTSDRIVAEDLAAALPGITMPDPGLFAALAPAPGVQRVFHVPELLRLAKRLHWNGEILADVCLERRVEPPDPGRLVEAMRRTLPQATIRLVEYSRSSVPAGEIVFPMSGLQAGVHGALWNGYVSYGGTRRFTLWARVEVAVTVERVIAAVDLPAGKAIDAAQVRRETSEEFPAKGLFLEAENEAIGRWPRAAIRAGRALRAEMLQDPKDVSRGDTVTVDVRNGAAHLELQAQAEAAGSVGETIPVVNPESHKRFQARVEGKGRVAVGVAATSIAAPKENK